MEMIRSPRVRAVLLAPLLSLGVYAAFRHMGSPQNAAVYLADSDDSPLPADHRALEDALMMAQSEVRAAEREGRDDDARRGRERIERILKALQQAGQASSQQAKGF